MCFSHVNYPPELQSVNQKNQISLHEQIRLTRHRLVKTKRWSKHTAYFTHLFSFCTLATGGFGKAKKGQPGSRPESPHAPGRLHWPRPHRQFPAQVRCPSQVSYWHKLFFFPLNNVQSKQIRSLLVACRSTRDAASRAAPQPRRAGQAAAAVRCRGQPQGRPRSHKGCEEQTALTLAGALRGATGLFSTP